MKKKVDIFDLVERDHEAISILLEKIEDTSEYSVRARERLFADLQKLLKSHLWAEEEAMYTILRGYPTLFRSVETSTEEHEMIERALTRLDQMDKGIPAWTESFEELLEDVEYHLSMEEGDLFERMKQVVAPEHLGEMVRLFQEYKARFEAELARAA